MFVWVIIVVVYLLISFGASSLYQEWGMAEKGANALAFLLPLAIIVIGYAIYFIHDKNRRDKIAVNNHEFFVKNSFNDNNCAVEYCLFKMYIDGNRVAYSYTGDSWLENMNHACIFTITNPPCAVKLNYKTGYNAKIQSKRDAKLAAIAALTDTGVIMGNAEDNCLKNVCLIYNNSIIPLSVGDIEITRENINELLKIEKEVNDLFNKAYQNSLKK